jgi:serine/threonine protein phosphatase PrpC
MVFFQLVEQWEIFFLKDFGLISEPHITKIEINYDDKFCIIASDGIWDVITEEMVFNMTKKVESAEDLANKILKLALNLGSQDNISVVVIGFNLKNENVNKDI